MSRLKDLGAAALAVVVSGPVDLGAAAAEDCSADANHCGTCFRESVTDWMAAVLVSGVAAVPVSEAAVALVSEAEAALVLEAEAALVLEAEVALASEAQAVEATAVASCKVVC